MVFIKNQRMRRIGRRKWVAHNMNHTRLLLLLFVLGTLSCSTPPETPIYKIHEYCRKDKTDPAVVVKMRLLGLDLSKEDSKYFEPKSRTDYKYILVALNPQTDMDIQGFFITWKKDMGGLTYEEIQQRVGLTLPKRGAKEIRAGQSFGDETEYSIRGYENAKHPDLLHVTVTCAKDNYDMCWEIDIACFDFVHK